MKPNVYLNMVTEGCYYDSVHDRCGCIWLLPVHDQLCGNPEKCTVVRPADRYNIVDGVLTPTEPGQGCTIMRYDNGKHIPDYVEEWYDEKDLEPAPEIPRKGQLTLEVFT